MADYPQVGEHPYGDVLKNYIDSGDARGTPGADGPQGEPGVGVPAGGGAGQVLTKTSGTDFATDWEDPGESLPAGGTTGQVLTKASGTDGDADWEDAAGGQPLDADLTALAALDSSTAGVPASDGAGWIKKTYAQLKTALGLVKADVGLSNVDNTSDVNKPVSTAQATAIALKAPTLPDSGAEITAAGPGTSAVNTTERINTTSNAVARALPSAPTIGTQVRYKVTAPNPLVNAFTWSTSGSDVINRAGGATTGTLVLVGAWAEFTYIGSNIWVKVEGEPLAQLDTRYPVATLDTDTTLAANSDTRIASQKAGKAYTDSAVASASAATTTLLALVAFKADALLAGPSVASGGAISASATTGKVDIAAGLDFITPNRVTVPAATAITCCSLADGTNPRWLLLEVDSTGTVQGNLGAAAANPVMPVATAGRTPHALVYLPANVTTVDALVTTANGKAKIYDVRPIQPIGLGASLDGWTADGAAWTYGDASHIGLVGDATGYLQTGALLSYNDGAVDYAVVGGCAAFPASPVTGITSDITNSKFTKTSVGLIANFPCTLSGLSTTTGVTNGTLYWVVNANANDFQLATTLGGTPITLGGTVDSATITLTGGTVMHLIENDDYAVANATLTATRYSYAANPKGFPSDFGFTPTLTGWSASASIYRFMTKGRYLTLTVAQLTPGTSTATTHSFILPVTARTLTNYKVLASCVAIDNGGTQAAGLLQVVSGSAVCTVFSTPAGGTWTASGNSRIVAGQVVYTF